MPNTISSKKALRQSKAKKGYNLFWKQKIKNAVKSLKALIMDGETDKSITSKELSLFQKVLDKASKNKTIHKNKANRLKSRYAHKLAALEVKTSKPSEKKTTGKNSAGKAKSSK